LMLIIAFNVFIFVCMVIVKEQRYIVQLLYLHSTDDFAQMSG